MKASLLAVVTMWLLVLVVLLTSCGKEEKEDEIVCDYILRGLCVVTNGYAIDKVRLEQAMVALQDNINANELLDKPSEILDIEALFGETEARLLLVDKIEDCDGCFGATIQNTMQVIVSSDNSCYVTAGVATHEMMHIIATAWMHASRTDSALHDVPWLFGYWANKNNIPIDQMMNVISYSTLVDISYICE